LVGKVVEVGTWGSTVMSHDASTVAETKKMAGLTPKQRQNRRQISKRMLIDIVAIIDFVLVIASAFVIKRIYVDPYYGIDGGSADMAGNRMSYLGVIALVGVTLFTAQNRRRYYNWDSFQKWGSINEIIRLASAVIFSFGFALFVLFMFKESAQYSRVWVLTWCSTVFVLLLVQRAFWSLQFERLAAKGFFRQCAILIGAGGALNEAKEALLSSHSNWELVSVVDCGNSDDLNEQKLVELESRLAHTISLGQSTNVDEVIIAFPVTYGGMVDHIVRALRLLPVNIKIACAFKGYKCKFGAFSQIGDSNYVNVSNKPISEWNVVIKALEDYLIGGISLLLFMPLMLFIAVLIKFDSKGPVLFRQRRHGCNHKVINVIKFRTMTVMEDGQDIKQATKNDTRVTRIGRILRKTSLDELPQLLNVLTGEMSLVGPRPHALAHNDSYSQWMEDYAARHRVKPGLTGWAQINGARGEVSTPDMMQQRVQYDLDYIDNWSIWFDLRILLLTPIYGFVSKRAY
jgi:putative colanic acid biosysnthesis UDP-glucose lipid carrier transferase